MRLLKVAQLEGLYVLVFGVLHFAIPFLLPPNYIAQTTVFGFIRIADFVLPGCFLLAISTLVFFVTKNRYPAGLLAFLYGGGITFHALYLSGVFPPVILVPSSLFLVVGIVVDALAIGSIYDYHRRLHIPAV